MVSFQGVDSMSSTIWTSSSYPGSGINSSPVMQISHTVTTSNAQQTNITNAVPQYSDYQTVTNTGVWGGQGVYIGDPPVYVGDILTIGPANTPEWVSVPVAPGYLETIQQLLAAGLIEMGAEGTLNFVPARPAPKKKPNQLQRYHSCTSMRKSCI